MTSSGSGQRPGAASSPARAGLALGIAAYTCWGLLPIYFKWLQGVPATAIVAHRIVWSALFLAALLSVTRLWGEVGAVLRRPATMRLLALSALLIGINWLIYVYAVNSGHIMAGSLGYYLNPLANILLGRFVLGEPLDRRQWLAVALAGVGVAILAVGAISHLWISLALCGSFAVYGLLRKVAKADAVAGLSVETMLLLLPAIAWLSWTTGSVPGTWGAEEGDLPLLLATGIVSSVPLLLFTAAARRLPYSTLGILQFLAPTLQFLVAVFLYGEAFTTAHAFAFGFIWVAALLYLRSALVPATR